MPIRRMKMLAGWTCSFLVLSGIVGFTTFPLQDAALFTDGDDERRGRVIDNFEADEEGAWPSQWQFLNSKQQYVPLEEVMAEDEKFFIVKENGNKFVRAYTEDEAQRITVPTYGSRGIEWDLDEYARLRWEWRAHQLPEGASEDDVNDTGGALYVTFSVDWLGRPKSIKYTYSSTLPVGTVVSFGRLKVIVVSSGANGIGSWKTIERNVAEDYRRVFDARPPDEPLGITLWSDSDDTGDEAVVDFDNIVLLPAKSTR